MSSSRGKPLTIVTTIGWLILGVALSIVALQRPLFEENQNTKFLHAAAANGYGFLSHDWMANTLDPLPAFTLLIETLFRLHSLQIVYVLFPILLAILLWSLTSISNRLFGIKHHTAALALFLGLLFVEEKNMQLGFGTQYLIGHYFQPCVFGVLIILGIERFLAGARIWASLAIAVGAAFHPAYMPAALLIQGSFTALTIYRDKKINRDALLPLMLFIGLSAPLLIRYKLLFAYSTPDIGREAMSILSTQRIATHTKVSHWINYEDYISMAIIVISMGIVRKSPLFWIMLPLAAVIAVTVPLLYFVSWPSLEVLTPWRTSVILLPLAYTILAGKLSASLMPLMERKPLARQILLLVGCIGVIAPVMAHLPAQASALFATKESPEEKLMNFARHHSTADDLWLIPTRDGKFDPFRLETGAPIFINLKTHPYKDREILEWYRRNRKAEAFYKNEATSSGPELLRALHANYGITHAIIDRNVPESLYTDLHICWKDQRYMIVGFETTEPSKRIEHHL